MFTETWESSGVAGRSTTAGAAATFADSRVWLQGSCSRKRLCMFLCLSRPSGQPRKRAAAARPATRVGSTAGTVRQQAHPTHAHARAHTLIHTPTKHTPLWLRMVCCGCAPTSLTPGIWTVRPAHAGRCAPVPQMPSPHRDRKYRRQGWCGCRRLVPSRRTQRRRGVGMRSTGPAVGEAHMHAWRRCAPLERGRRAAERVRRPWAGRAPVVEAGVRREAAGIPRRARPAVHLSRRTASLVRPHPRHGARQSVTGVGAVVGKSESARS